MSSIQAVDSVWLSDVMDKIGASDKMRRKHEEAGINLEILHTLLRGNHTIYNFGSNCEGTTTPGMNSDLDIVICDNTTVCEFFIDGLKEDYLLMIQDEHTRPGYVKLQAVKDGVRLSKKDWKMIPANVRDQFKVDCSGRIVRSNCSVAGEKFLIERQTNGPAETFNVSYFIETDSVHACRYNCWPTRAMEWLYRVRPSQWPTKEMIDTVQELGCIFVRIGHPDSDESHLEWRVSFSLQERELMFSLNETQYKCYIILKLIKKDIIKATIGESLSSYHCKICLFYAIENAPKNLWVKENLNDCVMYCLNQLYSWVESGNCPHYFIPEQNMFERRVKGRVRSRLKQLLGDLIGEGLTFLHQIETDMVGKYLLQHRVPSAINDLEKVSKEAVAVRSCLIHLGTINEICVTKKKLLQSVLDTCLQTNLLSLFDGKSVFNIIHGHYNLLQQLYNVERITEHTEKQTNNALELLLPFLHTSFACQLVSYAIQLENPTIRNWFIVWSALQFAYGMKSDVSSSRLKFTTVLLALRLYDQCEHELDTVEKSLKMHGAFACKCREIRPNYDENVKNMLKSNDLNTKEILHSFFSTCVMFLPTEMAITPEALRYEMFRSVGTNRESIFEEADHWYGWAAVDSIVYLYFLRYILAVETGKTKAVRCLAIKNIAQTLEKTLNHRETAFNLLAWASARETFTVQAIKSLIASWKELKGYELYYHIDIQRNQQEQHNAAKWHMLVLMYKLWNKTSEYAVEDSSTSIFCFNCMASYIDRRAIKTCSRCHVARYCSKACQAKDWPKHKAACTIRKNFPLD